MWILFSKLGDENANVYMDLTGNVNKWSGPGVKQIVIWGLCRYHANYCQHTMSNRWSWPSDCTCTRCSQYSVMLASTHNPNTMWSQRRGSPPSIAGNQEGITDEIVFEMDLRKEQFVYFQLHLNVSQSKQVGRLLAPQHPTLFHVLSQVFLCQVCLASLLHLSNSYQPLTAWCRPSLCIKAMRTAQVANAHWECTRGTPLLKEASGHSSADELGKAVLLGVVSSFPVWASRMHSLAPWLQADLFACFP